MTSPPIPLKELLLDILRHEGRMTFERAMSLCLYHPEFGYYMRGAERTGVRGDYFTSPDLHPIFARLIARQAAEMWEVLGKPARFTWVEMGPGRGGFARDFMSWAGRARPDFFGTLDYVAIEPAPRRRACLEQYLADSSAAPGGGANQPLKIRLLAALGEINPVTGCFFSNEVVDSLPVSVVTRAGGHLKEIYVAAKGESFGEEPGPISDARIAAAAARYAKQLEEGHRMEVCLAASQWIQTVAEKLAAGFVLTIDYGDLAPYLYTPSRPRGTLVAYRSHVASGDFFAAPGEQDLTAHVNFSALIESGERTGLELTGFTTQERFLMALGEPSQFSELDDPGLAEEEKLQARLKLKRLINPEGMGSIFKVLVQHRGVRTPNLTGLKWARPI